MAIQTTNSKPTPVMHNNQCLHCGGSFNFKRSTKRFCSRRCQKAAERAAAKVQDPQHQVLFHRLEAWGFIGQVWPVYSWDNSPKIIGLLVPKGVAAAELGISKTELGLVMRSFGIKRKGIEEELITKLRKTKQWERNKRADEKEPRQTKTGGGAQ
jgi:hypothetical protein